MSPLHSLLLVIHSYLPTRWVARFNNTNLLYLPFTNTYLKTYYIYIPILSKSRISERSKNMRNSNLGMLNRAKYYECVSFQQPRFDSPQVLIVVISPFLFFHSLSLSISPCFKGSILNCQVVGFDNVWPKKKKSLKKGENFRTFLGSIAERKIRFIFWNLWSGINYLFSFINSLCMKLIFV